MRAKGYCQYPDHYLTYKIDQGQENRFKLANNKEDCEGTPVEYGGEMVKLKWIETGEHGIDAPDCLASPWSRDNHHGNNKDGFMNSYNWTVPDSLIHTNCALRLRYNITSGEFNEGGFDSDINASLNAEKDDAPTGIDIATMNGLPVDNDRGYYFQQDPVVKVFDFKAMDMEGEGVQLEVTLNTNQYGRTFEDRSHLFEVRRRPEDIPEDAEIHNLNVRGKRGNIVQTYPSVEYDYHPNRLEMVQGDYLHIQWSGANSNPQNNAGQGRAGTDRSNIVPLKEITWEKEGYYNDPAHGCLACNYPEIMTASSKFLDFTKEEMMMLAYQTNNQYFGDLEELDDAPTHFSIGPKKITTAGIWRFLCTRNNNFTNRSQKGEIRVLTKEEAAKTR